MDQDRRFESIYSKKMSAGRRRTYFFDVRRTKGDDFYLTLTESTKRLDGGFDRHKIFLYKEDFNRFVNNLVDAVEYIKTELMPDYDYEEFDRLHNEWEEQDALDENRPPRQDQPARRVYDDEDVENKPREKPFPPADNNTGDPKPSWKKPAPPTDQDMEDDLTW